MSKRLCLSIAVVASLAEGCIIAGDKCDAHQVHVDTDYDICVCEPNAVLDADGVGCTPCGETQEVQNGLCSCKAGFVRASDGKTCVVSEIGARCTLDAPCSSPSFPYCAAAPATEGYCTQQGCTANVDCPSGWSCELASGTRYCRRPPTGLGAPCKSGDECTTFDANFCDTVQTKTCLLQGCASGGVACPNEWGCCDYSALFGAPLSFCSAPASLVGGACPQGGQLVSP